MDNAVDPNGPWSDFGAAPSSPPDVTTSATGGTAPSGPDGPWSDFGHLPQAASSDGASDTPADHEITVHPTAGKQLPAPMPVVQSPLPEPPSSPPAASQSSLYDDFEAGLRGAGRAVPFVDDLSAANDTLFSYLPESVRPYLSDNSKDQSGEPFSQRYQENLANQRSINAQNDTDHPIPSYGGQVAGAFALPVGAAGKISGALPSFVPRALGTAVGAGAVGAGYGALYGAGQGTDLNDRLQRAKEGAVYGGLAGAAAPAVAGAATSLMSGLAAPLRMATQPAKVAAQRISKVLTNDASSAGGAGLSSTDIAAAMANNQPAVVADVGGEATRALARSAANNSPEARTALTSASSDRFASQNTRFSSFMKGVFGNDLDNQAVRDDLASRAKAINGPAYRAAYLKGASGIWDADLAALVQAPDLQSAIGDATRKGANNAVLNGNQIVRSPFFKDANGNMTLVKDANGNTAYPSLQYWDQVKRALDDKISVARRAGNLEDARDFNALKQALVGKLDDAVPEYANARQGAFRMFGAENALEAGEKFLGMSSAVNISAAKKAFLAMAPQQREFFAQGLASQIMQKAQNASERSDVIKLFNSPQTMDKMRLGLGQDRANQIEAYLRRESMMDRLRTALGNSTTARQMIESGHAEGHGNSGHGLLGMVTGSLSSPMAGAVAGAAGAYHEHGFDPEEMAKYAAGGALFGMLGKFVKSTNQNVVRHVGEMLASNDPKVISQVTKQIARDPDLLQAMRRAEMTMLGTAARIGSGQDQAARVPSVQ